MYYILSVDMNKSIYWSIDRGRDMVFLMRHGVKCWQYNDS